MSIAPDLQERYKHLMMEISYRMDFVDYMHRTDTGRYPRTQAESMCLQLRLTLESVAYACLTANGNQPLPRRITKDYHAVQIMTALEAINPECYPQPMNLIKDDGADDPRISDSSRYAGRLADRTDNRWLTRDEFREVYGRLGGVLHVRNPFRSRSDDLEYYQQRIPEWARKISSLLTLHQIRIAATHRMYIAQIRGTGDVALTEFHRM